MYMAANVTLECVRDPFASSPTETLLRLLLLQNDEVHQTSKDMFCNAEQINLRIIQCVQEART